MRALFVVVLAALLWAAPVGTQAASDPLVIPSIEPGKSRPITIADLAAVRKVGSLSVSPDGERFAIFVTQGDTGTNSYRTGWFVGNVRGGALTPLGDGGDVRYSKRPTGFIVGDIESRESRWSKDGQWIAYALRRDGEIQLWRSNVRTGVQEQVTHNASDIRDFDWSEDGRLLYFTAGTTRVGLAQKEDERERRGYRYDDELMTFTDLMLPERRIPFEKDLKTWIVTLDARQERLASDEERSEFERMRTRNAGGKEPARGSLQDAAVPPVARPDGALAWLARSKSASVYLRVMMRPSSNKDPVACEAKECFGLIDRVWWSESGREIFFWRHEGINGLADHGFYAWVPSTGAVKLVLRVDDSLRHCAPATGDRLICTRETKSQPGHVAAIDMTSGALGVIAGVNPEFRNIRLGRVERFEWDTPKLAWNEPGGALAGLYPKRAYGYILYPPDFDPNKKYPAFVDPYDAQGFNSSVGGEHALHVYAANGFVVLNLRFPHGVDAGERLGARLMQQTYAEELDFPHLTMLMESTLRGLQVVEARGFIDPARIGIGGVSHGTFVPLYLMQKHDRIAAISISSSHWGPHEYYWGTAAVEKATRASYGALGYEDWRPKPEGKGREFWSKIDIAEHVDEIEAPVLMNLSADETYGLLHLIRHLRDAGRPYDAYVFDKETHLKWRPAHLYHIMTRNLDWFRFWLQDVEDPDPAKAEQYERWRRLRELQCRNPRSLRDYCTVTPTSH